MFPNMMINPIQPVQAFPINPFLQPTTIKIEIVPSGVQTPQVANKPAPQAEEKKQPSVYDMPKASVYEPKQADAKETAKPSVSASQALAAQTMVQPAKVAEVAPKETPKTEDKKVVNKKPEIVAPEQMKTSIDLNGLIAILTSPDYEEQADAMEAISEVVLYAPDRADELLDNKVVDTLLNIMDKDTSKLQGKEKELADRNKEYAMFTTATLQKLYAKEVKDVAKSTVPVDDLIGMAGIVNQLKTNPNASVREAAVASLGYVSQPEYKKDLFGLLKEATTDRDATVQAQANKQLEKVLNA